MSNVDLRHGDCLDVLKTLDADSIDSIVTDPPYGFGDGKRAGFMGKQWDYDVPSVDIWAECLRVLKPGGHLLAFAGTRTQHRMCVNIEDAGFEIRDMIAWVYGSGMPKSLDVSKAIDKTAPRRGLFDAFAQHFSERLKASGKKQNEVAALFPSKSGGLTGCVWNWANGANVPTADQWRILQPLLSLSDEFAPLIDRIEAERKVVAQQSATRLAVAPGQDNDRSSTTLDITAPATPEAQQWEGWGTALKPALEPITVARKPLGERTVAANVLEHGTGALNIDGCRIKPSIAPGGREWEEQRNRAFLSAAIAALSDKLTELERCLSTAAEPVGLTTNAKGESSQRATCRLATGCSDGTRAASTSTSLSTGEFGRMPTAQSLTDIASIIETASKPTIDWTTWNSCQCPSTSAITSASITAALKSLKLAASSSSNVGTAGRWPSNLIHDGSEQPTALLRDSARFFYTAKASKDDRDKGNTHPTVKPTDLMAYLCRLVTPPGGIVLDPFMGSGTTGKAALSEGFQFIGIERDPDYYAICESRFNGAQIGLALAL